MSKSLYDIYLECPKVSTDSRNVVAGSIFFALRGGSFDGNLFAVDAMCSGAAYAVVDNPDVIPDGADGARYLLVGDVLSSLQELASMHRKMVGVRVISITGTNGKTTTKELTSAILSRKYKVHSTSGNLNNHIGVPLTLLSMPADTEVAVVEMGASGIGEIAALCEIAAPDYGLITNVGIAHLEGFGGVEGIRKAKGELYDYLERHGGAAFVNGADETLLSMASERPRLETIIYDTASARGMKNNLAGGYNIYNIAAAAAIGRRFGISDSDIAAAVAQYEPDSNRSRRVETGRNVIIADCYNANPSSMLAALGNFVAEQAPVIAIQEDLIRSESAKCVDDQHLQDADGDLVRDMNRCHSGDAKKMSLTSEGIIPDAEAAEKMVILGDMLELGRWASEQHYDILKAALEGGFRKVFLVGGNFGMAYQRYIMDKNSGDGNIVCSGSDVRHFPDTGALVDFIKEVGISGFFILLKGSRGIALEKILPFL